MTLRADRKWSSQNNLTLKAIKRRLPSIVGFEPGWWQHILFLVESEDNSLEIQMRRIII